MRTGFTLLTVLALLLIAAFGIQAQQILAQRDSLLDNHAGIGLPVADELVFVSSYMGPVDEVIEYDGNGIRRRAFEHETDPTDWTPVGLATNQAGDVFVASQTRAQADYAEILKVDVDTGEMTVFATVGIEGIFGITVGPNGNLFASSAMIDSAAKVVQYDGDTGALIGTFVPGPVQSPAPGGIAFGPNGNLFVGESGEIVEYDGETGQLIGVFATEGGLSAPNGLFFFPSGNLLVADSHEGLLEFNGVTGDFVRNLDSSGRFTAVAYLALGEVIASELDDQEVRRYAWPSGEYLGVFAGTPGYPQGIAVMGPPTSDSDGDGVIDGVDTCPDTFFPESVPTWRLGVNRWALVDDDGIFDSNPPPGGGNGPGYEFTLEDTAGCSCEQIIEELDLGQGHVKFGCSTGAMLEWTGMGDEEGDDGRPQEPTIFERNWNLPSNGAVNLAPRK